MVAASIPLKIKFMAKEDLWRHKWPRFWVSNFGAFPVHRGTIDTESIRTANHALEEGFSVIVFPEGGRSPNAQLQPALPGAVLIASRMKVPILPVSIAGSENFNHLAWHSFTIQPSPLQSESLLTSRRTTAACPARNAALWRTISWRK